MKLINIANRCFVSVCANHIHRDPTNQEPTNEETANGVYVNTKVMRIINEII
jgi:hypothetical protein